MAEKLNMSMDEFKAMLEDARCDHCDCMADPAGPFEWKDHSRFIEVRPVETGWLVLWGRYEDKGRRKLHAGNSVYLTLDGARRRVADAAMELTKSRTLAAEAVQTFDWFPFPNHRAQLPKPL
jgi:hypothetical protein